MTATKTTARPAARLPRLAVTAFICWTLGANTEVGAANTSFALRDPPAPSFAVRTNDNLPSYLHVLSDKDAALYHKIFSAQETLDWRTADTLIGELDDRRLMGHVLADRYKRHFASAEEMRAWLASYGDLPEAEDLYSRATTLAGKVKIPHPSTAAMWSGTDAYGSWYGFRTETTGNKDKGPAATRLLTSRINHALHRGDPFEAEAILENELKRHPLTPEKIASLQSLIAAGFFYAGHSEHALKLANEAGQLPLALWIKGLSAWQNDKPALSAAAFVHLAAEPKLSPWDRAAAQFWAYRAMERTGEVSEARYWLEQAAHQPHSFYGLLAAHLLGRESEWSWQVPELTANHVAILSKQTAGWRALALLQVGQKTLAEDELRHLNPQGHRDLQEAMLALAEKAQMPSLALQLGGIATKTNGKPYDAALYPVPPWQPAQGFQIDRALMFALMKHESQFNPQAVSARGACGLMQLMPATANVIANDDVADDECSSRLLDPAYNMALGQKYVRHLASQPTIGNSLLLILAAYNGGPSKLARWMDDSRRSDPLLFIESLPVRETHDYVQQVLMHYWNYRARLGESESSLTQLAQGEWPSIAISSEESQPRVKEVSLPPGLELVSYRRAY